jgi:predicted alpha-1,6-mannanase (GH76 family)
VTGEIVDPEEVVEHHPDASDEHVWAEWRAATLEELVHTWPSRDPPGEYEKIRGWWQPTLDELRDARRTTKSRERRKSGSVGGSVHSS